MWWWCGGVVVVARVTRRRLRRLRRCPRFSHRERPAREERGGGAAALRAATYDSVRPLFLLLLLLQLPASVASVRLPTPHRLRLIPHPARLGRKSLPDEVGQLFWAEVRTLMRQHLVANVSRHREHLTGTVAQEPYRDLRRRWHIGGGGRWHRRGGAGQSLSAYPVGVACRLH